MANTADYVERFTANRIQYILHMKNEGPQKAILANLRRGVGRAPGELPELWGEFLALVEDNQEEIPGGLPEDWYGSDITGPSRAEWAVYSALTLFALHQQGHDPGKEPMHQEGIGLGTAAARAGRSDVEKPSEDERTTAFDRVRRRFNTAATAESVDKLSWHLRGLIRLMKDKAVPLDYGELAKDLYLYQIPAMQNSIRLKWGQDLYREYYRAASGGGKDDSHD